jgi:hypothetical protein
MHRRPSTIVVRGDVPPMPWPVMRDSSYCSSTTCPVESNTAQRINRSVFSKNSMHCSVRAFSNSYSSASDRQEGGKTLSCPSSSAYDLVCASTLAAGDSSLARRASSISFWSTRSLFLLRLARLPMMDDLLNDLNEHFRTMHVPLRYFRTNSWSPIIGCISYGQSGGQYSRRFLG